MPIRTSSLVFSLLLVASSSHAQHYRVVKADDLKSLNDFRLGATCESVQTQLESRDADTFPQLRYICKGQGYRSVKVSSYVSDTTLVVSLTPDNIVWKISIYIRRAEKALQANADALQMFYEKFGRPVLEEDISVGGTVPTLDGLKSFGKLVFKHAWATSQLNPATTINTVPRFSCQMQPQMSPACLTKYVEVSNENWEKQLAKLDGVVVIGQFNPSKDGMASFSVESYQKEHLEQSMLVPGGGK